MKIEIFIGLLVVAIVTVVVIRVMRYRRNKQAQERTRQLVEGLRDNTKSSPMPFANIKREPEQASSPSFTRKLGGSTTPNENLRD